MKQIVENKLKKVNIRPLRYGNPSKEKEKDMIVEIIRLLFFGSTGFFGTSVLVNSLTGDIIIAFIVGIAFSVIFVFALKKLAKEIRATLS